MLDYKLINYKPKLKINGGTDEYIDLLATTFNDNAVYTPKLIMVNKYYVARPDLISLAVYGDDRYADVICKINGISNPFELNENDILVIPNVEYLSKFLSKNRISSDIITDEENEVIQKIDVNNKQKRKDEIRTANEQTIGDANFIIDKSLGLVFY